jgi:hypothetical protein
MKELKLEFKKLLTQLALDFAFKICPSEGFKIEFARFLDANLKNL